MTARDLHAEKAAEIFKVPVEQVTPMQRRFAKTVTFGERYHANSNNVSIRQALKDHLEAIRGQLDDH